MIRSLLMLAALLFPATVFAAGSMEETLALGARQAVIWKPPQTHLPTPLIIFSHGFGGCATQSRFLARALAAHGYWVAAPNHKDNRCRSHARLPRTKVPEQSFTSPELWDDTVYLDRAEDIKAVLAAIKQQPNIKEKIDFDRMGLMGHSLGGYTVLGLGGAWPSWKMPGIKAILALSPYSQPFNAHHTLDGLSAPVMYQGGIRDAGTTPALRKPGGSYAMSPPPKYFVEFRQAGHFAWTDLQERYHDAINAYALAFFDHYVKGEPPNTILTTRGTDVSTLFYDVKSEK